MPRAPEPIAARRTFAIVLAVGAFLAGGLCVGLITALAADRALDSARDQSRAAHAEAERSLEQALAAIESSSAAPSPAEAPTPESPAIERTSVEGWYSAALIAMAREGIARGWAKVRDDAPDEATYSQGLEQFRHSVETLPVSIGRRLAEELSRKELVEAGIENVGVFTFLELLDRGTIGPFPDLVEDAERFGALFPCSLSGPVLAGPEFVATGGPGSGLEDGTTIRFARGVFRVNQWTPRGVPPRCLTIEGAGMDATLLLASDYGDGGRVDRLAIRDCTILSSSLFDFRGRGSQVLVERVRVLGFDSGAGGSSCLDLDQTALLMRDCRFEGGYGRHPASGGTLFDVRTSALLARFERCRFDAMRLELEGLRDRATVVFSDCSMTDLRDRRDPRTVEHPGIRLVRCSVQLAEPDPERSWARNLNELFPGWDGR